MKKISILGSTGSIGQSTLRVAKHLPDSIQVKALAAHSNLLVLVEQIHQFSPELVAVYDSKKAEELRKLFPRLTILSGEEGLSAVATYPEVDLVVVAIVGLQALNPTIRAIQSGKDIGLATKEVLVSAGELIRQLVEKQGVRLLPIDSEHNAIFQCLEGKKTEEVLRVILTASGGPFRSHTLEQLSTVTLDEALAHPTWKMGPKVTVDSSTLMNKGLEMIEARYLFDLPPEKIEVIIHPQSIIHSLVEMVDGCILAEMSEPNMIYPIQHVLTYPEKKPKMFPKFDFLKNNCLEFYPPDVKKFPALDFAREALEVGESVPCYLNAANEVLVSRFLKSEISWRGMIERMEKLLSRHRIEPTASLEAVLSVDEMARQEALIA